MDENNIIFKENVKNSFIKVKKHIIKLENEIKDLKELILRQKEEIKALNEEKSYFLKDNKKINENNQYFNNGSIGNKGVYSFIHSFTKHSFIKQLDDIDDLISRFQLLPKQELLVFLALYHLEEELKRPITYLDISKPLKLSEGCIRTYISNLIKKGFPILKKRINNKIVTLNIEDKLKKLNIKQKLEDIYYGLSQDQTKLF